MRLWPKVGTYKIFVSLITEVVLSGYRGYIRRQPFPLYSKNVSPATSIVPDCTENVSNLPKSKVICELAAVSKIQLFSCLWWALIAVKTTSVPASDCPVDACYCCPATSKETCADSVFISAFVSLSAFPFPFWSLFFWSFSFWFCFFLFACSSLSLWH